MSTTIYLDVDGVINAIGRTHPEPKHTGFPEYKSIMANGYQIAYAPELIAMLNALAARDDVTIKWLTTWEHDAAKVLSPLIGLDGMDWQRDSLTPKVHPTQKPIGVIGRLIETFTDPGDVVIDPCAGSGVTLLAAENLGRKSYGFEINKKFVTAFETQIRPQVRELLF